jgi:hypothetical protein
MTGELISATALLAANALLLGATAIELMRVRHIARRWRERPVAAEGQGSMEEARQLLGALDERIAELKRLAAAVAPAEAAPPAAPFDRAARLARSGANADELVRACGLNRGAAELLVRLHAGAPEGVRDPRLSRPGQPRRRPVAAEPATFRLRG